MIDKLYQESHGIPGKIIKMQADLSRISPSNHIKWVMPLVASLVIAAGIGYLFKDQLLGDKNDHELPFIYQGKVQVDITPSAIDRQNEAVPLPSANLPEENETEPFVLVTEQLAVGENDERKTNQQLGSIEPIKEDGFSAQHQVTEYPPGADSLTVGKSIAQPVTHLKPPGLITQTPEMAEQPKQETQIIQAETSVMERESAAPTSVAASPEPLVQMQQPGTVTQESDPAEQTSTATVVPAETVKKQTDKNSLAANDDTQWLFQQPGKNYTLQLMSLKNKASLISVKKKYRHLAGDLHIYRKIKDGLERYILLYGSFSSSEKAAKTMQSLPDEFRKPWKRRFRVLQKEIKTNIKESTL